MIYMFGTGRYRGSSIFLARCPQSGLTPFSRATLSYCSLSRFCSHVSLLFMMCSHFVLLAIHSLPSYHWWSGGAAGWNGTGAVSLAAPLDRNIHGVGELSVVYALQRFVLCYFNYSPFPTLLCQWSLRAEGPWSNPQVIPIPTFPGHANWGGPYGGYILPTEPLRQANSNIYVFQLALSLWVPYRVFILDVPLQM